MTKREPVVPGIMAERNPSLPRLVRDNRRFLRAAAAVKTGD